MGVGGVVVSIGQAFIVQASLAIPEYLSTPGVDVATPIPPNDPKILDIINLNPLLSLMCGVQVWLAGHAPQLGLPDLSDAALVASADHWLAPHLGGVRSKAHLQQLDLSSILRCHDVHPCIHIARSMLNPTLTRSEWTGV